jgi:hypothetical protein
MPLPGRLPGIATVPLLFAAGAALTPVASGYLPRHARTGLPDAGLIAWISRQSAFRDRGEPIFVAPTNVGPLAGDRLQHDLHLVPFHARCAQLEAQSRRGWIVLHMDAVTGPYAARSCLHERRPDYEDRNYRVFAPPPRAAP